MAIRLVMTCHAEGWRQYGRNMVATFVQHWPKDITLEVYAEGFVPDLDWSSIVVRELPEWHTAWKLKHVEHEDAHGRDKTKFGPHARRKNSAYDYRRDCVRFSHKVAALTDAALNHPLVYTGERPAAGDWLIMADADLLTHQPVTEEWLRSLVTDPEFYVAWLDRIGWYPECGFVIFREDHPNHRAFMQLFQDTYEHGSVFQMKETHDSFVLAELMTKACKRGWFRPPFGLSDKIGKRNSHPFVHSRLAERLDHAKGKFKAIGRTPKGQARHRKEGHW